MARTLIIGYGNPLRGDDGVGWHVAQQLVAAPWDDEIHIITCHQLTPELAEPLSQAKRVVFIDAEVQASPGTFTCRWIVATPDLPGTFSHHLTPAALLAWAKCFYGTAPEAVVVCMAGASFGCSEVLSPAVQAALPACVAQVRALAR